MGLPSFFTEDEIQCRCGCGFVKAIPHFYFKMNLLRLYVGGPIKITSWCRCLKHNAKEGGSKTSSHLEGLAADIWIPTDYMKYTVLYCAGLIEFRGVGIAENFIHIDDDPDKDRGRLWTY